MSVNKPNQHVASKPGDRKVFGENIKCTLIGDKNVGKTSMLLSYQTDTYPSEYVPTILDTYSKATTYNDKRINLQLYDIGGKQNLENFKGQGQIGTDVFLLCFAIDNRESFTSVSSKWMPQIRKYWLSSLSSDDNAGDRKSWWIEPLIILVGCKNDKSSTKSLLHEIRLRRPSRNKDPRASLESQGLVAPKEAIETKKQIGAYLYLECCSRIGTGITEIFNAAINAVLQRRSFISSRR